MTEAITLDTAAIERLTGAKGTLDPKEGVFKVSLPRADIAATVGGARMTPPLGLTAWAAFTKAGTHTMVMPAGSPVPRCLATTVYWVCRRSTRDPSYAAIRSTG